MPTDAHVLPGLNSSFPSSGAESSERLAGFVLLAWGSGFELCPFIMYGVPFTLPLWHFNAKVPWEREEVWIN